MYHDVSPSLKKLTITFFITYTAHYMKAEPSKEWSYFKSFKSGTIISHGKSGMIGVYKIETQMTSGSGKFDKTGIGSDREAKEAVDTAFKYLKWVNL